MKHPSLIAACLAVFFYIDNTPCNGYTITRAVPNQRWNAKSFRTTTSHYQSTTTTTTTRFLPFVPIHSGWISPTRSFALPSSDFDEDNKGSSNSSDSEALNDEDDGSDWSSKEMWQSVNEVAAQKMSVADMLLDAENDPLVQLAAENAQNEFLSAMKDVKRDFKAMKEELGSDGAVDKVIDQLRKEDEEEAAAIAQNSDSGGEEVDIKEEESSNDSEDCDAYQ